VSPELEATTLGAAHLAGMAQGVWAGPDDIAEAWRPRVVMEPTGRDPERSRWREALSRARQWHPELSAISF
jgi:glycerol kinase